METKEYHFVDKSTWGDGPWMSEPDKVQYPDPDTGLPCLAVRNPSLGHWCGYVGVTESHPDFGKGYDDSDANVHGGLTFADFCQPDPTHHGICHVAGDGEPDKVWWLGFDCAHYIDMSPGTESSLREMRTQQGRPSETPMGVYRTLEYVKNECANLARQLSEVTK